MNHPIRPTSTPSLRRLMVATCLLGMISLSLTGCAQAVLLGYLIGGPPSIEPAFETETKKSIVGTGEKVVVICYADPGVRLKHAKIDYEMSSRVASMFAENNIKVVEPEYVRDWIDKHRDWETADEVGEALGAKYVVEIELIDFSLYEENSAILFRGRTEGSVNCYLLSEGGHSEKIFATDLSFTFPLSQPRTSYETTEVDFKREYLSRLSEMIGQYFYPRYHGDRYSWAT
ncbi:MAG: hypothetical protein R3C01_04090 [Planctomycetaceae bacterium]